ncbi:MAG: amidase family protein [Defluviitaleaceae bacterium]|nr:amidase family protein [Defluviitaleaceae bacterium]
MDHYTVFLEDSIMQKDTLVTAGSKMLENFVSPFDATVVKRLSESQFSLAGRVIMDEFGIPSLIFEGNEPLGAVKAVADGTASHALCNDLFGKYRKQATENGCCYIHPTYGTVSRFGLIPLASSMDQIGVVCKNLHDGFALLSQIAGKDPRDGAMFPEESYNYAPTSKNIRIGIPKFVNIETIENFAKNFQTIDIELAHFEAYKQVMYILSCAEISNNISRYDGVKFGHRATSFRGLDDLYIKTRSEGFGADVKLTAIMGTMMLSQKQYAPYYEKAMKIRRLIKESLKFDTYDIIAMPCKISDDPYENLALYALPTLAGLPAVSFAHKGCGIQLIANTKCESALLSAWEVCMA